MSAPSDNQALQKLQQDVELIKKALLGDMTAGKDARGVIANVLTIMDDLYKNGSGIKLRVQKLEEYRLKIIGYCGGVSLSAALIVWVADRFVLKK